MILAPKSFETPETMYCRGYNKRLSIFVCMANFVDANALKQKDRPCHQCAQGEQARACFGKS